MFVSPQAGATPGRPCLNALEPLKTMAAVLATPPPILPPSHKVSTIARVASLAARASAPANLPGPTLHITFKTVSFEQAGRYFLTLTAPDGTEHRTEGHQVLPAHIFELVCRINNNIDEALSVVPSRKRVHE